MARKSAAKLKPVQPEQYKPELPPIEDVFADAKEMFGMTVETNIKTAGRIDNLMNLRDYAYKFWGNTLDEKYDDGKKRLDYFKSLQELSISTYSKIKEVVDTFDLEEFSKETIKDYFAVITPEPDAIDDEEELCRAGIIWLSVRPYGDKMLQLHQLIQDEIGKRKAYE